MKYINHKTKVLVLSTFVIFALSAVLITIESVSTGAEMASLEKTSNVLLAQRSELESAYVKSISMGDLQERSAELGFVKPEYLIYLTGRDSVAKLP
ncbi:MAG: hypothetical protein AAB622_01595 [Patescibacteria group bacterium]